MKIARRALAAALFVFALGGLPLPGPSIAVLSVKEPTESMKSEIKPVARAVSSMSAIDRLWLQYIYQNAAKIVTQDGESSEPSMDTTDGLRAVHISVLAYIWRGLADNQPGKYPQLKDAIEAAFDGTIGDDRRVLTPELRAKAAELFEAIAWAGLGKDG
jgi:hypothetical protein